MAVVYDSKQRGTFRNNKHDKFIIRCIREASVPVRCLSSRRTGLSAVPRAADTARDLGVLQRAGKSSILIPYFYIYFIPKRIIR